jgi:hypothetical protein
MYCFAGHHCSNPLKIKKMYKVNQIPPKNQENKTNNSQRLEKFMAKHSWMRLFEGFNEIKDPAKKLAAFYALVPLCPKTIKKILALLSKMNEQYEKINPSEEFIADEINCSRTYVSENVNFLALVGIILIIPGVWIPAKYICGKLYKAGRWTQNTYEFAPFFDTLEAREKLAALLPDCQALQYSLEMAKERELLNSIPFIRDPYNEQASGCESTQLRPFRVIRSDRIAECLLISDCKVQSFEKGQTMTLPNRNEMVRSLESLKNTPMSEADVALIGAYPDEVIAYANLCTNRKGILVNPIGYFLVCCREYSKKLANGVNQSSHFETQKRSPQKGTSQPSAPMTSQQIIENKERIDKLCNQTLKQCQARAHIKAYERGLIPKDLCERLLDSIGMLDACRPQIVQPGPSLPPIEICPRVSSDVI